MNAMSSTVAVIHKLEAAGFDRKQAEAQVEAVAELVAADSATKDDVAAIDRKLDTLRTDIDALRTDIDRKLDTLRTDIDRKIDELRTDIDRKIDALRADVNRKIDALQADVDRKIDALRSDMEILKRDLTIRLGSMMVVAVGAVAAMVKLL